MYRLRSKAPRQRESIVAMPCFVAPFWRVLLGREVDVVWLLALPLDFCLSRFFSLLCCVEDVSKFSCVCTRLSSFAEAPNAPGGSAPPSCRFHVTHDF